MRTGDLGFDKELHVVAISTVEAGVSPANSNKQPGTAATTEEIRVPRPIWLLPRPVAPPSVS